MDYKGYTARVVFDEDAGVLFGEVDGLRDVVTFEATNTKDLTIAFRESVDDYLSMCAERGEEPEKPYSGKFLVRTDPRLHRELAIAAANSGKSLNAFTSELLKSWVQRDRRTKAAARSTTNPAAKAGQVSEPLNVYATNEQADRQRGSTVWGEVTRSTPASITPARASDTPSSSRTPKSHKQSSKAA